jgi:hypothetical protein
VSDPQPFPSRDATPFALKSSTILRVGSPAMVLSMASRTTGDVSGSRTSRYPGPSSLKAAFQPKAARPPRCLPSRTM